ncbi:neuropeptide FF receptor 2-like isoform X2 [Mytilus californianus]|uniref:neuropeptide FF receptor 2-like isoform X2 n=1 Tax=Mytilus californianus TaxID=6549 RepID=UPI0022461FF2|nr:neuropeptide FF receptor 2-like isoform X2 [Mytilus californianus]
MSGGEALGDVPGLAASLTIMCVLAVILNSIVIVVFATKAQSFTSVHLFIMNLCISDIFLAGIALPVRLDNGSHEGESFKGGDPVCKMIMFIPLLSISSSISTMVAIAVDRFREIIKRHKLLSKQAMYVIMVSWVWSVVEILGLDDTLHTESGTHVTKNVLVVLSTMSNPVIYFVFDAKFRKDLLQLLTRKPCGQLHVNQVQPSTDVINELRNKLNTASTTVESFETD